MKGEKVWEIPVKNELIKEVEYGEKENKTKQDNNKTKKTKKCIYSPYSQEIYLGIRTLRLALFYVGQMLAFCIHLCTAVYWHFRI